MTTIDALDWRKRFVERMPGDPRSDNIPRQVRGAAYTRVAPTPVAAPRILALVPEVCALLDLEPSPDLAEILAGNKIVPGMAPYAACYGGHQFGNWAGQLGDGRAITLGEVTNTRGETLELQLKGAGKTPYSRTADGRAVLRSSLRELVCSEAMFHLGVPTTRALSLVWTGESVMRDILYDGHPALEPGAIVCRVAPSFLRFGNYEIFAARGDKDSLSKLVTHTVDTYYPGMSIGQFVAEVCRRTAKMVVDWMRVGFVHGVMNTDNMSILGLTIDYGPYGWIEPFDPDWTPNTTDAEGRRYRFSNQPAVAHWNLVRLAQAVAPLVEDIAEMEQALDAYVEVLGPGQHAMLLGKLGLRPDDATRESDQALLESMLALLGDAHEIDMTWFYRRLAAPSPSLEALLPAYYQPDDIGAPHAEAMRAWLAQYAARAQHERVDDAERARRMNATNPIYVPRNYLLHEVIEKTAAGDTTALADLIDVLRRPYDERPGLEAYAAKRPSWAEDKPGCSMLSCSS